MVTLPASPSKVLALKPRLRNHLFTHGSEFAACSLPGATLEHLCEFSDYIIVITLLVAFS